MTEAEKILIKKTKTYVDEAYCKKDVLDAMEEYAQYKVNELNKSDVIKSVCGNCGEKMLEYKEIYICEKCRVWKPMKQTVL